MTLVISPSGSRVYVGVIIWLTLVISLSGSRVYVGVIIWLCAPRVSLGVDILLWPSRGSPGGSPGVDIASSLCTQLLLSPLKLTLTWTQNYLELLCVVATMVYPGVKYRWSPGRFSSETNHHRASRTWRQAGSGSRSSSVDDIYHFCWMFFYETNIYDTANATGHIKSKAN